MEKLYIVIPAYNEEMNIGKVARDWHRIVKKVSADSRLVIIDDGSTDTTYERLMALQDKLPQLEVLTKPNSGHGATLLFGYQYALEHGADYIFQTDSDGQTVPGEFGAFWKRRHKHDALIGVRRQREDGISRIFVTQTLRVVLRAIFKINIPDANTPFRLMKRSLLEKYLPQIPKDFNLSNVMLSVLFLHYGENVRFLPITFHPRQGGVNSINLIKITKIGWQAVKDFREIRRSLEQTPS